MKAEGNGNGVMRPDTVRAAAGFTLIELMVTIAVLAILLAIAAPSLETMLNQNRLAAASDQVIATLHNARMEAVRQNRRVELCNSGDGSQCLDDQDAWSGLLLWTNGKNGGGGDRPLAFTRMKAPIALMPASGFGGDGGSRIAYGADGRPSPLLSGPLAIRVCVPTTRPAQNIRDVMLHPTGRLEVVAASGGGGCPAP